MTHASATEESTLYLCYPQYVPTASDLAHAKTRLADAYHDYTAHVSPPQMAIAFETAAYILWASDRQPIRSAVDFGSGFTSYVLRLVCEDVWSVDDSPEWLAWTQRFLDRYDLDTGHLIVWDEYRALDLHHDLVVYDFSSGPIRDANFQFAIGQLNAGGIGVMDDANHEGHQRSMYAAARKYGYDLFGLQDWTRDYFLRFAALVVAS